MTRAAKLEKKLARLAELRQAMSELGSLKLEFDALKADVLGEMAALKSRRTESVNGIYAVRAERTDVRVVEPAKVESWLGDNNFELSEYKRLDLTRVTPLVKAALKETGEVVPGTEVTTNEYLTIKESA